MQTLQVNHVTKNYGDKTAVNGIDFQVAKGEIFGLLGGNGAGKTTTMRMVMGLIYPDGGEILWNGQGYSDSLYRMMGYLPEERGLYPKVKVCDQILYLAELRGMARNQADRSLKEWLERFEVPEYYGIRVEELSKGNQQKIQFIAAVIHRPGILILDEAFSGLDPVNVELLKATVTDLRKQGTTILFSSHRMDHVEELCENICILNKSNTVLQGNLRQIKNSFPKERVVLEATREVNGLEHIPGVRSVVKLGSAGNKAGHEAAYEIKIDHSEAAEQILNQAMSQAGITRFQIMEPSLNEIFISKVGGNHE